MITAPGVETWFKVKLFGMLRYNGMGGEGILSERETVSWLLRDVTLTSSVRTAY